MNKIIDIREIIFQNTDLDREASEFVAEKIGEQLEQKHEESQNALSIALKSNTDLVKQKDELQQQLKQKEEEIERLTNTLVEVAEYLTTVKDVPNDNAEEKLLQRIMKLYLEMRDKNGTQNK